MTEEIDNILENGGFKIKEWLSNEQLQKNTASQPQNDMQVRQLQQGSEDKVLGVAWNSVNDNLSFVTKVECDNPSTKRKILKSVQCPQSPRSIGFATAFLIRAKISLQELWQMGVDWDDDLPAEIKGKWMKFLEELKEDILPERTVCTRKYRPAYPLCLRRCI